MPFMGFICRILMHTARRAVSGAAFQVEVAVTIWLQTALAMSIAVAVWWDAPDLDVRPLIEGDAVISVIPLLHDMLLDSPSYPGTVAAAVTLSLLCLMLKSDALAAAICPTITRLMPIDFMFQYVMVHGRCVCDMTALLMHVQLQLPLLMVQLCSTSSATTASLPPIIWNCMLSQSFGAWLITLLGSPEENVCAVRLLKSWGCLRRPSVPWNSALGRLPYHEGAYGGMLISCTLPCKPVPISAECLKVLLGWAGRSLQSARAMCGIIADLWHLTDAPARADVGVFMGVISMVGGMAREAAEAARAGNLGDRDMHACTWGMHMMCKLLASAPGSIYYQLQQAGFDRRLGAVMRSVEAVLRRSAKMHGNWVCMDAATVAVAIYRLNCLLEKAIPANFDDTDLDHPEASLISIASTVHKLQGARLSRVVSQHVRAPAAQGTVTDDNIEGSLQLVANALASWRRCSGVRGRRGYPLLLELCGYLLLPNLFSRLRDIGKITTAVRILHKADLYLLTALPSTRGVACPVLQRLRAIGDGGLVMSLLTGVEESGTWCRFLRNDPELGVMIQASTGTDLQSGVESGVGAFWDTMRCIMRAPTAKAPVEDWSWDDRLMEYLRYTCGQWRGCAHLRCRSLVGDSEYGLRARKCGGCKCARYCSKECQRAAWPQHQVACNKVNSDK